MRGLKTRVAWLVVGVGALASVPAGAAILAGPVFDGGSTYYLISKNSWTGAEAEAQTLGGTLVTVNSAAENAFLANTVRPERACDSSAMDWAYGCRGGGHFCLGERRARHVHELECGDGGAE